VVAIVLSTLVISGIALCFIIISAIVVVLFVRKWMYTYAGFGVLKSEDDGIELEQQIEKQEESDEKQEESDEKQDIDKQ